MDKTEQVAAAADAFNQAEQGFGVALVIHSVITEGIKVG